MDPYSLETYVAKVLNTQELKLEVRSVRNMLYIEKLEFMKENMAEEAQLFYEMIHFPYILVDTIKANVRGAQLRTIHSCTYQCEQKQVIYVVWIDKDKNIIKPDNWLYQFANEDDTFTVY